MEYRKQLFEEFWSLSDYSKQQSYLLRLIHPQLIKRRRYGKYDHPSESRRQHSFSYFLLLRGGSEVRVCLKTFCNTFGVTPRRVQLAGEKILKGDMVGLDKRGGARKNVENENWNERIVEHIKSFPTYESHYCRKKNPNKLFLSPDLNVSRMYKEFLAKYAPNHVGKPPVSRQWYHEIFLSKFNLSFQSPKVDTCSTCDAYAVQIKAGDTSVKVDQELHHRKAEAAFKAMNADETNAKTSDAYVITFDMQQQMYIPQLTHSEMYYSQQVACCNLGIHDSVTGNGCMCLWSENFGGRGSQEISSCIYEYLTTTNLRGKKKLICWSDNCGGQNKNQFMLAMYLVLIANNYFSEIIHKFPVKGHTFLSCDRDFALIEKRKKVCKALTLKDIAVVITSAAHKNPFTCMIEEEFFDFKVVAQKFLNTKKLGISSSTQLRLTAADFGTVHVATTFGELTEWGTGINILNKGVTIRDFKNIHLPRNRTRCGVPEKKKADIRKMMPYLQPEVRTYFQEMLEETQLDLVQENDDGQ